MRVGFCNSRASMRLTNSTKAQWQRRPNRSSCSASHMKSISNSRLRILLELRPALGGHAGIPQATRLLFRSLAPLDGVRIEGLLQSGERLLSVGLPPRGSGWLSALTKDRELNRLGRVVIA